MDVSEFWMKFQMMGEMIYQGSDMGASNAVVIWTDGF